MLFFVIAQCSYGQQSVWDDVQKTEQSQPVLSFKTNLLGDVASVVNVGMEVPLGKRVSLAAEAYCPWWKLPKYDVTVQLMAATLEGRIWLGHRQQRRVMTGFFTGLYAGAGYYDFQLGGDGVQGEMFIMGGLSAGYAHRISKHFHMEYTLGIGYLETDYREYYPAKGTEYGDIKARKYPWATQRFSGFIPTKVGVSLVWTIGHKKGRRAHEK